jgi:hypothetical protein
MAVARHHQGAAVCVAKLNRNSKMIKAELEELCRAEVAQIVPTTVDPGQVQPLDGSGRDPEFASNLALCQPRLRHSVTTYPLPPGLAATAAAAARPSRGFAPTPSTLGGQR